MWYVLWDIKKQSTDILKNQNHLLTKLNLVFLKVVGNCYMHLLKICYLFFRPSVCSPSITMIQSDKWDAAKEAACGVTGTNLIHNHSPQSSSLSAHYCWWTTVLMVLKCVGKLNNGNLVSDTGEFVTRLLLSQTVVTYISSVLCARMFSTQGR